jgi:hypothetical protein
VEGVCALLTSPSPEILEGCERILENACSSFGALSPDRADLPAIQRLQTAIRQAGHLLDSAFQYHDRWKRRLNASLAGYRPGGLPAPVSHQSRVSWEG